ncbi:hypothetical protein [Vibrio sp. HN007]|uniref:hypothetical protein n=1 Tax=Vibrio iocasae TaxID=3098914 RepID=UPI0035D51E8F
MKALWPIPLLIIAAFLVPGLLLIYLMMGLIVKIGYLFLKDESLGEGKEPVFHTGMGIVMEVYRILTWPAYFKGISRQGLIKIIGGVFCTVSVIVGSFYYLGFNTDVPQIVIDEYHETLADNTSPLSKSVKNEISVRIEKGFKYRDFLWAKAQQLQSCNKGFQPESAIDQFSAVLKVGLFGLKPGLADSLILVEHLASKKSCKAANTTD